MSISKAMKILYVEDDPGSARLFQRALTRLGYDVDLAADGEEGLAKWLGGSYDVLATDHDMPKMKAFAESTAALPPPLVTALKKVDLQLDHLIN
ncbi:response regulator [Thermodesulfobacteriota bacterium]